MPTARVFEDLVIWQMAGVQCDDIYHLIEVGTFAKDTPLADQINRSSGSVMDNIAEGFDRFSRADFRHFLIIARGSNAEVRSQLYRSKSRKHIPLEAADALVEKSRVLGIKINSFIQYLDRSDYKSKPKGSSGNDMAEEIDVAYTHDNILLSYTIPTTFIHPQ